MAGMADSADLVVLGAYYGVGNNGGLLSVYLMGCYDTDNKRYLHKIKSFFITRYVMPSSKYQRWKTVCKVGNGHDDATTLRLQGELKPLMKKIHKNYDKVPSWLDVHRYVKATFAGEKMYNNFSILGCMYQTL